MLGSLRHLVSDYALLCPLLAVVFGCGGEQNGNDLPFNRSEQPSSGDGFDIEPSSGDGFDIGKVAGFWAISVVEKANNCAKIGDSPEDPPVLKFVLNGDLTEIAAYGCEEASDETCGTDDAMVFSIRENKIVSEETDSEDLGSGILECFLEVKIVSQAQFDTQEHFLGTQQVDCFFKGADIESCKGLIEAQVDDEVDDCQVTRDIEGSKVQ